MRHLEKSKVKANLADTLTFSRLLIGLMIVALSSVGKEAYPPVVVLGLLGALTDILDGMAARRWLNKDEKSHLGQYDLEIDTILIMSILAYFSLSGIVIPKFIGMGWIILCLGAVLFFKRSRKVLLFFEIPAICGVIICGGLYNFRIFQKVLVAIAAGVILNFKRIRHLIMVDFPRSFSKNGD